MDRRPTPQISESQNAPDYSGVIHVWGNRRLVVSPTGRRYLVQEYRPDSNTFRNVHWAKTGARIAQRAPELVDFVTERPLPDNPAEAAPATVAKRAAENKGAAGYPEFSCDYRAVIARDGRLRIALSLRADAYLWQAATTYKGSNRVRPNTWQNIYKALTASELKGHLAEAQIIWPDLLDPKGRSPKLRNAIARLPERPHEVSLSNLTGAQTS